MWLAWATIIAASIADGIFQTIATRSAHPERLRLPAWMFDKEKSLYGLGKWPNITGSDDPFHQLQSLYVVLVFLAGTLFAGHLSPALAAKMFLVYYWGPREMLLHVFLPRPGFREIPIIRFTKKLRNFKW